ncbi:hypothetical protein RhiirA1_542904 [Rhizophagus irregularis]|uniref:F-box domain-containing protein n=1 Tax=Rhizophagus irregularis TaxID=588596 RepID=A0A2N0QTM9_9GLOM|nr:hypothetical protein RhiirA1_542904 [Rhizophagus irregularis]
MVEVIDIIISHIDKSDSSTLLNVSLINREWCLIGILHLWKNQFININSKARFKVYSKILLSHLDNKTQSFLKVKDSFDETELEIFSKVLKSPRNLRKLRVRYWKVDIDVFKEFFKNYGTFLNEFECSCTGEEPDIRTLVMNLVKEMNRI